jgi:outer membrane protein assembly factor BamA
VLYNSPVNLRSLLLPISVFLFCATLPGQKTNQSKLSYKLLSVHVKGQNQFKEDQIVAASGLKLGQFAGEEEFKQASQKLGETGLFTNLTYSYHYSTAGCDLELQVAENDKLVPILFDNFVWFTDDDLLKMLRARLPLFDGRVPPGGNLTDQISGALTALLSERKIFGEVQYLGFGPLDGPIESYAYSVKLHPVVVRNMDFPGAAPDEIPALQAAARPLSGQEYLRTRMRVQERLNFLPVYRSRGYLRAKFEDAQAKVAEDGSQTLVDVSFPVTPGLQYKLTDLQFAGNTVFAPDQLRPLVRLKNSEPANAVQLSEDVEQIEKLYGTKGYLAAHITPTPTMDDAGSSVHYQLAVSEGDLYHMGELSIDGIPLENAKKMIAQWQLKKGDPYDASYLAKFFKIMYHDVGLRVPYNVIPKQEVNQTDKTVSVALHFVPKG